MKPAATPTARRASLALSRTLAATGAAGLAQRLSPRPAARWVGRALEADALRPLARRLADSPEPERRTLAEMLADAIEAGDCEAALALVSTAARRPDDRAEKILSARYRFVWIGVPKVASRSLIAALRAADPGAKLVRGQTLDALLRARPEAQDWFSFAFLRHPCTRLLSFYADKHVRGGADARERRWFINPWHGLYPGMGFRALCRWLETPAGSDAFADRHWLSQSRLVVRADGRRPDFLGRYENLQADWRALCERLGLPFAALPRLNPARYRAMAPVPADSRMFEQLRRRYAADYALGGYAAAPAAWPW